MSEREEFPTEAMTATDATAATTDSNGSISQHHHRSHPISAHTGDRQFGRHAANHENGVISSASQPALDHSLTNSHSHSQSNVRSTGGPSLSVPSSSELLSDKDVSSSVATPVVNPVKKSSSGATASSNIDMLAMAMEDEPSDFTITTPARTPARNGPSKGVSFANAGPDGSSSSPGSMRSRTGPPSRVPSRALTGSSKFLSSSYKGDSVSDTGESVNSANSSQYTERQWSYIEQIQLMRESLNGEDFLAHDQNFLFNFGHYGYSYCPIGQTERKNERRKESERQSLAMMGVSGGSTGTSTPAQSSERENKRMFTRVAEREKVDKKDSESKTTEITDAAVNGATDSAGAEEEKKESEKESTPIKKSLDDRLLSLLTSLTDEHTAVSELKVKKKVNPDFFITQLIRCLYLPTVDGQTVPTDELTDTVTGERLVAYSLSTFQRHIVHILQKYPFWPTRDHHKFRAITFWTENHLLMSLSSAYLFYHYLLREEREGRIDLFCIDVDLSLLSHVDSLLRLYLEAHICDAERNPMGLGYLYELNSVTCLKYSLTALLNLIDFAPEQDSLTIRAWAGTLVYTIVYRLCQVTDPLSGVCALSVAGRFYDDKQYANVHGLDIHCLIKAMNRGVSPDERYKPNYLTGVLTTTTWIPTDNLFDVLHASGSIAVKDIVSHSTEDIDTYIYKRLLSEDRYGHIHESDIVPFYWSAGLLLHPKFVSRSIQYMEDMHILDHPDLIVHQLLAAAFRRGLQVEDLENALKGTAGEFFSKHPNLLKVLAVEVYVPIRLILEPLWLINDSETFNSKVIDMCERITDHLSHWTRGQVYTGIHMNIYKLPQYGLLLSSLESFNVNHASFQQSSWMCNLHGLPIFTRSGPGRTLFNTQQCANFNTPECRQKGDILLVSYVTNNAHFKVEEPGPVKIHLFWPYHHLVTAAQDGRTVISTHQWKAEMGFDVLDAVTHHDDFYYAYRENGMGTDGRTTSKVNAAGERDLDFALVEEGLNDKPIDGGPVEGENVNIEMSASESEVRPKKKDKKHVAPGSSTDDTGNNSRKSEKIEKRPQLVWRIAEHEGAYIAVLPTQQLYYNEGPLPFKSGDHAYYSQTLSDNGNITESYALDNERRESDTERGALRKRESVREIDGEGLTVVHDNDHSQSLVTDSYYTTNRYISFVIVVGSKGQYSSVRDFLTSRLRHIRVAEEKRSTGPGKTFVQRLHRSIHQECYVETKVYDLKDTPDTPTEVFAVVQEIDDNLHPIGSAFKGAVDSYHWTKTHVVQPIKRFTRRVSTGIKNMFNGGSNSNSSNK